MHNNRSFEDESGAKSEIFTNNECHQIKNNVQQNRFVTETSNIILERLETFFIFRKQFSFFFFRILRAVTLM
jgi:hypothetical protein